MIGTGRRRVLSNFRGPGPRAWRRPGGAWPNLCPPPTGEGPTARRWAREKARQGPGPVLVTPGREAGPARTTAPVAWRSGWGGPGVGRDDGGPRPPARAARPPAAGRSAVRSVRRTDPERARTWAVHPAQRRHKAARRASRPFPGRRPFDDGDRRPGRPPRCGEGGRGEVGRDSGGPSTLGGDPPGGLIEADRVPGRPGAGLHPGGAEPSAVAPVDAGEVAAVGKRCQRGPKKKWPIPANPPDAAAARRAAAAPRSRFSGGGRSSGFHRRACGDRPARAGAAGKSRGNSPAVARRTVN